MNLGTIGRLLAIALGIASATLMATKAFEFSFDDDFLRVLSLVEDFVGGLMKPLELVLVTPTVRWLHDQGFVFELYPHWNEAFVLLWLFLASTSRNFASLSLNFSNENFWQAVNSAFRRSWAAIAALLSSALAGTVPLEHPAVLWWPIMGYFLYRSGDNFIYAFKDRAYVLWGVLNLTVAAYFAALALGKVELPAVSGHPSLFWWPVAAYFGIRALGTTIRVVAGRRELPWATFILIITALAVALALGVIPGPTWLDFEHSPSPGLANLAAFGTVIAAWYLLNAFLVPDEGGADGNGGYLNRVFASSTARTALDILSVLGGAATIVYIGHVLV